MHRVDKKNPDTAVSTEHKTCHLNCICVYTVYVWFLWWKLTTFSGQLTRGTLSWYSAGGGTQTGSVGCCSVGCCCVDFGLSLTATAGVDRDAAPAAPAAAAAATTAVAGTAVWAAAVETVAVVELGGLSLVDASPSPSTRLPTAGWDTFVLLVLPRLPVLLRRSSAPSGLERVRGLSSTGRSSPSAGPGSGVSMEICVTMKIPRFSRVIPKKIESSSCTLFSKCF